jgi:hypothetical protein
MMCGLCRTRWHSRGLCPACIERILESGEAGPEEKDAQGRLAALSMVFAIAGWTLLLFGSIPLWGLGGQPHSELVLLGNLVVLASFVPALFSVGQAASVLRVRGERLGLAAASLVLGGLQLGLMIGFFLLNVWHN